VQPESTLLYAQTATIMPKNPTHNGAVTRNKKFKPFYTEFRTNGCVLVINFNQPEQLTMWQNASFDEVKCLI
jgi:hypothetical protein